MVLIFSILLDEAGHIKLTGTYCCPLRCLLNLCMSISANSVLCVSAKMIESFVMTGLFVELCCKSRVGHPWFSFAMQM